MVQCSIELYSNGRGIFYAGDTLKGTIVINADKSKKCRGLFFIVFGAAECHWNERRNSKHTVSFQGREIYLNQRTYLFGHQGAEAVEVPAGVHRYEFACQLPPSMPSSLEAMYGHIRYKVKAVLDIPWGSDKESEVQITIVRHDDLNLLPSLKFSSKCEEIKRFCCLFCQSEPLIMTVTLPYTGFVPGQVMPVEISYKNRSTTDIGLTRISVMRCIRFNSLTPYSNTKIEAEKQFEVSTKGVKRSEDKQFRVDITLPMTMIKSNLMFGRVIQISYSLNVEAVVSGFCSKNIKVSTPIEIGSIPLNFQTSQQQLMQPSPNPVCSPPTAPMFDFLPSFDEAMKMPSPDRRT